MPVGGTGRSDLPAAGAAGEAAVNPGTCAKSRGAWHLEVSYSLQGGDDVQGAESGDTSQHEQQIPRPLQPPPIPPDTRGSFSGINEPEKTWNLRASTRGGQGWC